MIRCTLMRANRRYALMRTSDTQYTRYAYDICEAHGFKHINPLDVANLDDLALSNSERNNLLERDNVLYVFVKWLGQYPYPGVIVDHVGHVTSS